MTTAVICGILICMKALATIALFLACTVLAIHALDQIETRMQRPEPAGAEFPKDLTPAGMVFDISVDARNARCKTFDVPAENQRCLFCVMSTKTQVSMSCWSKSP